MIASLLAAAAGEPSWLPPAASSAAPGVDRVFALIFWVCAFFFTVIVVATTVFVVKYRERRWSAPLPSPTHDSRLEIVWSVIPLALVVFMFATSTAAYVDLTELAPGERPDEIMATARKWSWSFDHPGGRNAPDLHVVLGRPVRITMSAQDVLHSLYVPAFRVKQDVVPGRYSTIHFKATLAGTFPLYCAEYCGTNHSLMTASVVVHPDQAAYDAWVKAGDDGALPLVEVGRRVYTTRGCNACHSDDGTPRAAPSFKGLWGKSELLTDGSSVTVDENYVRESIVDPRAKTAFGFQPIMPPTPLEERQFQGLFEWLKSLK